MDKQALFNSVGARRASPLHRIFALCALILFAALVVPTTAQDDEAVYVTTQDYLSLRQGPGRLFERIGIVPPETTLRAIGRTHDTRWIQVEYESKRGWLNSRWLVWMGDWMALPVDGIDPVPFARRTGAIAITNRPTPYYIEFGNVETRVGELEEKTKVELTGRFGSSDMIWLQFQLDGQYYWAGSWNFNLYGDILNLPDAASVFPYGRVLGRIRGGLRNTQDTYTDIARIWRDLDAGRGVSCNTIPRRLRVIDFLPSDLAQAEILSPAARAVATAVSDINTAIDLFEGACNSPDRVIMREVVDHALALIDDADRNFTIARTLFEPLALLDPAVGGSG